MTAHPKSLVGQPLLLGIAGCSGSGKTTLAHELAGQLDATLLPLDLYYRDLSHLPAAARSTVNFDHPDSLEIDLLLRHLRQLMAGHPVDCPVYDFSSHTRSPGKTQPLAPAPVLLVEGLLALHFPDLRALFDLSVFVQAPDAVCLTRRIERDLRERGRTESSVREQFKRTTQPMADQFVLPSAAFASVTVDGTDSPAISVATVLSHLDRAGQLSRQA